MSDTTTEQGREQLRAELAEHTMYELLGGADGLRALADRFYDTMDADPAFAPIRSMHEGDLAPIKELLFEYLSGWLGGPSLFVARRGSPCLTEAHAPFAIDEHARDLWLACMIRTMNDGGVPERYRDALMPAFAGMADMMRTR